MYAQLLNLRLSWKGSPLADTGHGTNRKWQASGACGPCKPTRVKSKRFHSTPPLILCPPPAPGFPPLLPTLSILFLFYLPFTWSLLLCATCPGQRKKKAAGTSRAEEVVLAAIARDPCRSLWAFSASSGASCPSCPSSSSCCSWAPSKVTADAAYTPVNLQCLEDNYSTVIRVYGL